MIKNKIVFRIILILLLVGSTLAQPNASDSITYSSSDINFDDYYLFKTIPLTKAQFDFAGKVELWLDKRLAKRKDPSSRYGVNKIDTIEEEETNFLMAVLKIFQKNGKETDRKILQRAFASINEDSLYGNNHRVLVVAEDFTNDFGTYSGPLSSFYNIEGGRLKPLKIKNLKTGKWRPMAFSETGKAAWKMVPTKTGKGMEFLQISCHIDFNKPRRKRGVPPLHTQDADFAIDYTRISFDGTKWLEKTKTVSGYWDGEDPFPNESLFP
jgi:hypothetical protein